jgi:PleD family two-component response regulator
VLCDRVADLDDARAGAERVRIALRRPVAMGSTSLVTTASVGVALGRPGDVPAELLRRADVGLYQAKAGGRDRTATLDDRRAAR